MYKVIQLEEIRETGRLEIETFAEIDFDDSEIYIQDINIIKRKGNSIASYDLNENLLSKFEQVQQIKVLK